MRGAVDFILQVATVALIAGVIRWLFRARDASLPRTRNGTNIYGIKWQWQAFGITVGIFSIALFIWSWHDLGHPDKVMSAISLIFVTSSVWLSAGSVSTNQLCITKTVFWRSRSLPWSDITEIRLQKKQGGAIELYTGTQKLIIDSRFVAYQHLLNEIAEHTQLQPITELS